MSERSVNFYGGAHINTEAYKEVVALCRMTDVEVRRAIMFHAPTIGISQHQSATINTHSQQTVNNTVNRSLLLLIYNKIALDLNTEPRKYII